MNFSEPPPTPLTGTADEPATRPSGPENSGPRTPHHWVSGNEDSLGPQFSLPEVTPPYIEDPWPATPAHVDDSLGPHGLVQPAPPQDDETQFRGEGGLPDDASITCRPFVPAMRFDSGEVETDQIESRDEDTMAGVAANSNRATRQSFELARGPVAPQSRTIRQAFPLRRLIGRGGYGEVWEAVQINLGRHVAVKHLRPDVMEQTRSRQPEIAQSLERAFENEALTAAMLEHPNIVPVYDLSTDADGTARLAMKLVRGSTWHDSLQADFESNMPVADFLAHHLPILVSISQAMAFAHSRGVVHRDLKPSQVMVGEFGEVLLMDWGIAAVFDSEVAVQHMPGFAPEQLLSHMEGPAGTPAFMAPEQTHKSQTGVGPWTDIYLLGGILYQILCGRPPHGATTGKKAFLQACEGLVVRPRQVVDGRRDVPQALEDLVMECLAIQPTDRPKSVKVFIRRIEEYLSGADRRREAEEIRNEILRRLPHCGNDYNELARLDALAIKARVLAPDNRHLTDTHELILSRYVRNALDHGDVMLARQQAERIEDPAEQRELLAEVAVTEERLAGRNRQHRAAMIAVAGMTLTLLTGGARSTYDRLESDRERAKAEFSRTSDQIRASFTESVRAHTENLRTVAAFSLAHPRASTAEFQIFARSLVGNKSDTQAVVYAPVVQAAERNDFEQRLRAEFSPVDGIRERRQNRFDVRAQDRDRYVPGRFAAPDTRAEEFVGLDYLTVNGVSAAVEMAKSSGNPEATPPIVYPDPATRTVAMVIPALAEVRSEPVGFAIGFWDVQKMLNQVLAQAPPNGVLVRVVDPGSDVSQGQSEALLAQWGEPLEESSTERNQQSRYPISIGGRRWMFEVSAPPHATDREVMAGLFREIIWPVSAIIIVVVGVLLSRLRLRTLLR